MENLILILVVLTVFKKNENNDKEELSDLMKFFIYCYIYQAMLSYCSKYRKNTESKNVRI